MPEEDLEEFRETFKEKDNAIEREPEPDDLIGFQDFMFNAIPLTVDKAIIYTLHEEEKEPELKKQIPLSFAALR